MFKRKSKSAKPAKPAKAKKEKKPKKAKKKREKPVKAARVFYIYKETSEIYTAMLVISFLAVLTSCILLYLELSRYGSYPWWKAI